MEWVGYWLDYIRFEAGITEKRAKWLVDWISGILESKSSLVRNVTKGLGRLGFAVGVLEWHRPFLAPLYAWTAVLPQGSYVPLLVMLRLTLKQLQTRLVEGARTVRCRPIESTREELFRTDASAHETQATMGGLGDKGRTG